MDLVTVPAPVRLLAGPVDLETITSILISVALSIDTHGSRLIAVVAHADCAGNPTDHEEQRRQLAESAGYLAENFPGVSILGLWVDERWSVSPTCSLGPAGEAGGQDA